MTSSNVISLEGLFRQAAEALKPPTRYRVSETAAQLRYINMPGSYVGRWTNEKTPYLVEFMDALQSRDHTGAVFVGPAQTGKTDVFLNWLLHSAKYDPADIMLIQTSRTTARDFSMRRIERLHRNNADDFAPILGKINTFDMTYLTGMLLTLSWPTINELSGKPIPRLWLTDYDRMTQNVDGEGNPFDLARKRATSFKSHGMCVAESSPGFMVDNPKWQRKTKHEAEPTKGILSLYNRGDRRRWYWQCVSCKTAFEPDFSLLRWPDSSDIMESAEQAVMCCPSCGEVYYHEGTETKPSKFDMNLNGRWIKDGQLWTTDDEIIGTPRRSDIASFWVKGTVAAFTDWKGLVLKWLMAEQEYETSGSEEALKATVNTDQGLPYTPKLLASDRSPDQIKARAITLEPQEVPAGVRFLIACIDVQKNRFVVQVHGIKMNGDVVVVDRFDVRKSRRMDPDGERYWVNPGAYQEDWKLLVEEVMLKSYALADKSGRRMGVKLTMCDSGGKDGVTSNAYDFFRWLRRGEDEMDESFIEDEGEYRWEPGLAARFMLIKGASNKNAPRFAISFPDSMRSDRHAGARGEVPVAMLNPNLLKDTVNNRLDRTDPGGMFIFPDWLPDTFYSELTVEVKDPIKGWINPKRYRNESWDLLAYCMAGLLHPEIRFEQMDWVNDCPEWAEEWDSNSMVFDPVEQAIPFDLQPETGYDWKKIAGALT